MKIAFVWNAPVSSFGGGERVLSITADMFIEKGHEVRIILLDPEGKDFQNKSKWVKPFSEYEDKLYLHRFKEKRFIVPRAFIKNIFGIKYSNGYDFIGGAVKDFKPDYLIVSNPFLIFSSKKALDYTGIDSKIIYWDHGSLFYPGFLGKSSHLRGFKNIRNRLADFIYKKAFKRADSFLCISTGIEEKILSINPGAKTFKIFNPLQNYDGPLIHRPEKPVFVYIGRLEDAQKNISFLLNAMKLLLEKDWHLKIIGSGPDEKMLRDLSVRTGIADRIEWAGFKKEPFEGLKEVTALLMTSRYEGFGMVIAEANQRGIPVISSDCQAGPSDIVIQGKNGYLYREGDMDDFIKITGDAIDGKLLFDSPENIAKSAERFSADKVIEKFIAALNMS